MPLSHNQKPQISLGEALAGHNNSLGVIRLVLAIAVIFDHAFPLGGFGADPLFAITQGQATLGSLAVQGFFGISGYLIAKSGASSDIVQFLWRRFLRIFPAYWTVLLFSAVIVGPIFWVLANNPITTYFNLSPGGAFTYLTNNWTLRVGQYGIHDIFLNTPWGEATQASIFNGSIWTLEYEWFSYMIIALFCVSGVLLRARILVPALTALFFILQILNVGNPGSVGEIFPFLSDPYRVSLPLVFLFGACLAMYSKKVPFDDQLAAISAFTFLATLFFGGYAALGTPAFVYFILWLGARLPKSFQWIGSKNDYSYGIYIYGFLVQQMLAFFEVYKWGYVLYVFLTLLFTVPLAWLSWHIVEKRAMALKDWGPGKGLSFLYFHREPKPNGSA